jgi:Uma2 family endonuclease
MATTTTRLTIDDFERLPDEQVKNHELVNGELVDVSGNTPQHNLIRDWFAEVLRPLVREHDLGLVITEQEYDFDGNAHGPDVSFFGTDKLPLLDMHKRVQRFVPDLAIEIVSERQTFQDLVRKKNRYRKCGTAEVWIVSPESREVYLYSDRGNRILAGEDELSTELLPGFRIPVKQLFETNLSAGPNTPRSA